MFLKQPTKDQVIALGGIFQACQLVEDLAHKGTAPTDSVTVCMEALLEQNPTNTISLYGGIDNLHIGFDAMRELLTIQGQTSNSDTLRYVMAVIFLRKALYRNPDTLKKVGEGIANAAQQSKHFSPVHENVLANLATIYQDTISKFRQRIQVNGLAANLQQERIAQRIRCLLFSGIRSAVLWHQLGGRRYHLILHRPQILNHLQQLQP